MSVPKLDGLIHPDAAEFASKWAAEERVIPVARRILADLYTPVGLYAALAQERPGTFLLESAENGKWSRFSIVGVASAATLTSHAGQAKWIGTPPTGTPLTGRAVDVLRDTVARFATPRDESLPPLTSGMVGCVSYDAVRNWERVPDTNPDELHFPELSMIFATDLAVYDHVDGSVLLIANAIASEGTTAEGAYADAQARINKMATDLANYTPAGTNIIAGNPQSEIVQERSPAYQAAVERAREHIYAGDAFQIVLSQRFEIPCPANSFDVYRTLRATNPSPYMYYFRLPSSDPTDPGYDVVGSSPEALVTVQSGRCLMHPIAGTRPRSSSAERDAELAEEMLADEKERAEHLMLVDLGRNDLGRVCAPGSVEVTEFMAVERYSHVMHIVSTVVGELAPGASAFDVLAATFPAGTLSGAPKPRAMEIIDDLENTRRGLYSGAVGYLDFANNMDVAIAIRTALVSDGKAYVQAGAGLVADSDPESEDAECRNKAAAVLNAIAMAAELTES